MNLKYCFMISMVFILKLCFVSDAYSQTVIDDGLANGNNYQKASFRLWMNDNVKTIRGVIVMMPGSNSDGRDMVYDTLWQKLAVRHGFALLGCYYTDKNHLNMEIEEYADVKNGSGQALLDVLRKFSSTIRHPELADAQLALWGMSAGGEYNYEFEKSGKFARFFFNNIIPLRLPSSSLNEPRELEKIVEKGYVGIISSGQILPENDNAKADITSWFPNRQIAEGWLGLIK